MALLAYPPCPDLCCDGSGLLVVVDFTGEVTQECICVTRDVMPADRALQLQRAVLAEIYEQAGTERLLAALAEEGVW